MKQITKTSPRAKGRIAGACYLAIFVAGYIYSVLVPNIGLLNNIDAATIDHIVLAFFGCYALLIGYLAFKSTFLPRPIGVLMGIAGLGWLTFFIPPIATHLLPYNLAAGLIGEGSIILWLLVKSVNSQRWNEQASKERS